MTEEYDGANTPKFDAKTQKTIAVTTAVTGLITVISVVVGNVNDVVQNVSGNIGQGATISPMASFFMWAIFAAGLIAFLGGAYKIKKLKDKDNWKFYKLK